MRRNAEGLFLLLGAEPHCDWLPDDVARDDRGFVLTGRDVPKSLWVDGLPPESLATSLSGVFAVGDIRRRLHEARRRGVRGGFVGRPARARLAEHSGVATHQRRASAPDALGVPDEVAAHDLLDPGPGVAALLEQTDQPVELVDAVQVGHEGQRVRALAGGADAGGLPLGDVVGQGEPVGVEVVDAGDGAVGADADGVLAADVDGVLEVRDDVGGGGVPVSGRGRA